MKHVSDKRKPAYDALLNNRPRSVEVRAGILQRNTNGGASGGDAHDDKSGLTVADLGNIHEFGLGVPERSFIRAWFDLNKDRILEILSKRLIAASLGTITWKQAADQVALWSGAEIQAFITAGIPPANAPETIRRKGSSTPLVDHAVLKSAITGEGTVL